MTPQAKMMYESFLIELLEDPSLIWIRWGKLSYAKEGIYIVIKGPKEVIEDIGSELDALVDGQYRIMASVLHGVLIKVESCEV
jgi:hypothetical protein